MPADKKGTIKAISFDAGHTLLRAVPSINHHYRAILVESGSRRMEKELEEIVNKTHAEFETRMFMEDLAHTDSDDQQREWWSQVDQAIARRAGVSKDPKAVAAKLWERFCQVDNWEPYPESKRVLGALRNSGYKVGVLSNWNSGLQAVLKHFELEKLLDFIVISGVEGVKKPGKRAFELAAERAEVPIHELLHVGDHPEADFHGARKAGAQAVLLGRDRSGTIDDDQVLANLREIFFICWEDRFGRYGPARKEPQAPRQRDVLRMWGEE